MSLLEFTVLASQDIDEIHDYIAERGVERAPRFIDRLQRRCQSIAENPGTGRRRDDLMPSLRSVAEGNYVIFDQPIEDGVLIMRVMHGAQNIQSHFRVDEETEEY